jgi:hypothetical protein
MFEANYRLADKTGAMSNFRTYINADLRHLRSTPVNSVTGPLHLYYQQRFRYSNAPFMPEVHDYRIVLRLR